MKRHICHADNDGECSWRYCPQIRDGEPAKSGRHCPYDQDVDSTPTKRKQKRR
jgi:hypothetical protein